MDNRTWTADFVGAGYLAPERKAGGSEETRMIPAGARHQAGLMTEIADAHSHARPLPWGIV